MAQQRILLLDNYDSFTFNLRHLVEQVSDAEVVVVRNDALQPTDTDAFSHIILSPGPGIPEEAGQLLPVIRYVLDKKPVLGVCLGHQALAVAADGSLRNLTQVFHGVAHPVVLADSPGSLFEGFPARFSGGRYHSWVVEEATLPDVYAVTARDESGLIMAMQHKQLPVFGVQFHPESILSEYGEQLLRNFLRL